VLPCADLNGKPVGFDLYQRMYYDLNPVGKSHWSNVMFGDKRDPLAACNSVLYMFS
jgi:hypothetical protein